MYISQNYPEEPVGETLVDYLCLFRYSKYVKLNVLSLLSFSLGNSVSVFFFSFLFFPFWLGIDYFQAVWMFLVFCFFIEFFPRYQFE